MQYSEQYVCFLAQMHRPKMTFYGLPHNTG